MRVNIPALVCLWLLMALSGCAAIPTLETPQVKITSLQMVPSSGLSQRIRIGLNITNPNAIDLAPQGMAYSVAIADFDVLSGVASDIPPLKAYQETPLVVEVSANLMGIFRLMKAYTQAPQGPLSYRLEAKLDFGLLMPALRLRETGELPTGVDAGAVQ